MVIVASDMREWKAPEKVGVVYVLTTITTCILPPACTINTCVTRVHAQADILVSELLGSWGDNELSPVSFVLV